MYWKDISYCIATSKVCLKNVNIVKFCQGFEDNFNNMFHVSMSIFALLMAEICKGNSIINKAPKNDSTVIVYGLGKNTIVDVPHI